MRSSRQGGRSIVTLMASLPREMYVEGKVFSEKVGLLAQKSRNIMGLRCKQRSKAVTCYLQIISFKPNAPISDKALHHDGGFFFRA